MAIELVSDIGRLALDLYAHGDAEAMKALQFISQVNPEIFNWLTDRLNSVVTIRKAQ
jgi:hypothetical protein